ncbi:hypothetical protein D3C72_1414770 [compost metagenome]
MAISARDGAPISKAVKGSSSTSTTIANVSMMAVAMGLPCSRMSSAIYTAAP